MRGLTIPPDVAGYLATRIDTNIRELEGAITKLQVQSQLEKAPIDLRMAQQAIGDRPEAGHQPTIHTVISVVTEFYGVRLTDLQSKRRHRSVTLPRQVSMYLARQHTRHSLEEIGGHFGGRDHTTVMHAVKIVEGRRKVDADFDAVLILLDDKLKQNGRNT
jgi:chromosomal replication initiator protein